MWIVLHGNDRPYLVLTSGNLWRNSGPTLSTGEICRSQKSWQLKFVLNKVDIKYMSLAELIIRGRWSKDSHCLIDGKATRTSHASFSSSEIRCPISETFCFVKMPQKVKIYVSRFAFSERAKKLEEKSKKITAIKPIIAKNLLGVWVTAP